jgi:hypothetical protein
MMDHHNKIHANREEDCVIKKCTIVRFFLFSNCLNKTVNKKKQEATAHIHYISFIKHKEASTKSIEYTTSCTML